MEIRELRDQRAKASAEYRAQLDALEAEERGPTKDEEARFEALNAEIAALDRDLRIKERGVELRRQAAEDSVASGASRPMVESVTDLTVGRPWKSMGEFFSAVQLAATGSIDTRLYAANPTGLGQQIPSEGGFGVPPQYSADIWNALADSPGNLLAMCDVYTITGDTMTFNANAETSRVEGSLYGGVRAYWLSEADEITPSKPKFRQMKLEPQEILALTYVTDKLLANAGPTLSQFVTRAASDAIMHTVNKALLQGSGAGQPLGLLNAACAISVAKETSQAAATINQKNISKMWARLHPLARQNAVWLHNVDIEPELDNLSTTVTNIAGTENVGGYANKVFDPERRTLKGRPLVAAEWCKTLGTVGDLILVDLTKYAAGVRGGVDTALSIHVRFQYAESAFRWKFAVDGQPWLASALTPAEGTNTQSTIITLATRS